VIAQRATEKTAGLLSHRWGKAAGVGRERKTGKTPQYKLKCVGYRVHLSVTFAMVYSCLYHFIYIIFVHSNILILIG
jgi:hypothetical protein